MGATREEVLNQAREWIGLNERDGSFKKILDIYNDNRPLPRGYRVKSSDEWCATFISALFIKCGASELISKECSCERFISIFKSMGIWVEDGTITPEAGDIILFNWNKKVQPNDGRANHIGIVEKVSNGTITTIEGNKSEAVGRRVIKVGNGNIRGFAKPKYKKLNEEATHSNTSSSTIKIKPAKGLDKKYSAAYITTTALNLRVGAGNEHKSIRVMPKGTQVRNYGYYTKASNGKIWLYVQLSDKTVGHCSLAYLRRIEK